MKAFIISLVFLPLLSFGQLIDDFSDGNFTTNPIWQGNEAVFKINSSFQLQLDQLSPIPDLADIAYLSSAIGLSDSLEWDFSIRLAFSPSDNNNARVYLFADKSDLSQDLNGYFLQFGEALSDDAIELFYQDGDQFQSICRGTDGRVAAAFDGNIKVLRKKDGSWFIYVDWNKSGNYALECSGQSVAEIDNPYFGFYCKFTSSNATKFYFDDVDIDYIFKDTEAPVLENIFVLSSKKLCVQFNETLDRESAENIQNYLIQQSNQNPISANRNPLNPSEVQLVFANDFPTNQNLSLHVSSIKDLDGNTLVNASGDFLFHLAEYGDVLIHEIMADPNPAQELPEEEYLELYNQSDYSVSLKDWQLHIGNSSFQFPNIELPSKAFLILTHTDNVNEFTSYGDVLSIPSFGLTNAGSSIILKNQSDQIIHYINYNDKWYNDDFKEDGGWSLEMISVEHFCEQSINWAASQNHQGGSPGNANSLENLHPDYQAPFIEAIDLINHNTLLIYFSKSMDSIALKNSQNYSADNDLGHPTEVKIFAPEYSISEISFTNAFAENTIYTLSIDQSLIGCCGSELDNNNKYFGLAQEPEIGDIVINEILFNAQLSDGEYVELYNRSDKIIDSRQLLLSRMLPDVYDTSYYSLQPYAGQFFPGEYLLLCKNKTSVLDVYFSENPEAIYAYDDFPTLTNTEGQVLLSKSSDKSFTIDLFSYHEDMHHPLFNNLCGIALERLSPEEPSNDSKNWQSAAASVNYGTPAYQNSQFQEGPDNQEIIQIYPEIFSPDMDGFDDILQINYTFDQSGYMLNLMIFNAQGQRIRHLVKNELLGISGQIFWDGTTEEGDKAPLGIYILYFEYFDLNGVVKKIKKTCVLGGKL